MQIGLEFVLFSKLEPFNAIALTNDVPFLLCCSNMLYYS